MTTRFSNGLAFSHDQETKLFQDMARRGKHLDGIALFGHGSVSYTHLRAHETS